MNTCPYCHTQTLVKAGRNASGTQRFQCKACRRISTPQPNAVGYSEATRSQALYLYEQGNGLRQTARLLGVVHQTVANWLRRDSSCRECARSTSR